MMSSPAGMIHGRNLLPSMNLIFGDTSIVTDVSWVFAGQPPATAVTPPQTVFDPIRLNCSAISPSVHVSFTRPHTFFVRRTSRPAPTYQPVLSLFWLHVLEPRPQSVKNCPPDYC